MKKMYEKNEVRHALIWIGLYLIISIIAINVGEILEINRFVITFIPLAILAIVLFLYLKKTGIDKKIGLSPKYEMSSAKLLYYIPLVLFSISPLVYGINKDLSWLDVTAIIVMMLSVGFLEEVIFRGLLYRGLLKKWKPITVIIFVSLTFGFGHITSILVGKELLWTLLQILNATIVGFMFLAVYMSNNNLVPVIIAHGVYNSLVNISLGATTAPKWLIIINTIISVSYSLYIIFYLKSLDKVIKTKK